MIITFCGHSKISEAITISEKLAEVLNGIFEKALADGLPLTFYCGGMVILTCLPPKALKKCEKNFLLCDAKRSSSPPISRHRIANGMPA